MADELDVLLEKVTDPNLRAELRAAVDKVRAKRNFGLVFESHLPERVRLPEHPVRRGTTVVVKVGDTLRVLDLHEAGVRAAVMEFDGAQVASLYEGSLARDYR